MRLMEEDVQCDVLMGTLHTSLVPRLSEGEGKESLVQTVHVYT